MLYYLVIFLMLAKTPVTMIVVPAGTLDQCVAMRAQSASR